MFVGSHEACAQPQTNNFSDKDSRHATYVTSMLPATLPVFKRRVNARHECYGRLKLVAGLRFLLAVVPALLALLAEFFRFLLFVVSGVGTGEPLVESWIYKSDYKPALLIKVTQLKTAQPI
ncbi:hypothetical protein F7725_010531 [Dissostichus mawsoni]|uniref:Uncharacterized protein n=1 Tax=Dissostichus mawsoni TaxID=36200 RepID=A0A7J5XPI1_DISMA|nr:hypothetical protein F7725_010531 [Dissostichus mawsoni]